jgi:hypothetical protein
VSRTGADGYPEVDKILSFGEPGKLPVDVAEIILINAMAPAASNAIKYATRENELRLLSSYLLEGLAGDIQLLDGEFRCSSLHVRRFVSESFGLGMLTSAVQSAYAWVAGSDALFNFDALPASLAVRYSKSRIRPDLLFRMAGSYLAGEARGRSSKASLSTRQQEGRLNTLLPWAHVNDQALVMTWAYLTSGGVTVDIYAPAGGIPWLENQVGVPQPPVVNVATPKGMDLRSDLLVSYEERPVLPENVPDEADLIATARRAAARSGGASNNSSTVSRSASLVSAETLFADGESMLPVIARQLFETAPETSVRLADRRVRGVWVPVDPVDPGRGSFLLGVLEDSLSAADSWSLTRGLRDRHRLPAEGDDDGLVRSELSVAVRGRLLLAVAPRRRGQPWDMLSD